MSDHGSSATRVPAETAEHRRFLIGDLVVRRVTYASVAHVAWPFFAALYAIGFGVGVAVWNVAALAGWSPDDRGLDGVTVAWAVIAAGLVVVPVAVGVTVAVAALYNAVSRHTGGLEFAVTSPRRHRRLPVDR